MPLTIKTDVLKYKKSNGEYCGFNAITQESTANQIASIEAAGATQINNINTLFQSQINAIQQKGLDIVSSIPEDYTTLSSELDALKNKQLEASQLFSGFSMTGNLVFDAQSGIVLTSPNGTLYQLKISDEGTLLINNIS